MTPNEAVAELHTAATALSTVAQTIAVDGSTAARQAILGTVIQHRATLSMSGLGATLDIETTVTASETSSQASLKATPANAWAIVDTGAGPHTERRRRGMPAAPYGVFSVVRHPGVAGLAVAAPARAAADLAVDDVARAAVQELPRHT